MKTTEDFIKEMESSNVLLTDGKKYISETKYGDGSIERVRYTKTREVHDFEGPNGNVSIWSKIRKPGRNR